MLSHEKLNSEAVMIIKNAEASDFAITANYIERISQSIRTMEQLIADKKDKNKEDYINKQIEKLQLDINHFLQNIINDIRQFVARHEKTITLKNQIEKEAIKLKENKEDPRAKQHLAELEKNLIKINSLIEKMLFQKHIILTLIADFQKTLPETYKNLKIIAFGEKHKIEKRNVQHQSGNLLMDALRTYADIRNQDIIEEKAKDQQNPEDLKKMEHQEAKIESGQLSAQRLSNFLDEVTQEAIKIDLEVKENMKEDKIFLSSIQNKKIRVALEKIIERINHEKILLTQKVNLNKLEKAEKIVIEIEGEPQGVFLDDDIIPPPIITHPATTQLHYLQNFLNTLIKTFKQQPVDLKECVALADAITVYPDLAKSIKQLNSLIAEEPVSIYFHEEFLSQISSFTKKSEGANPGYQVSTDQKSYTVKQGKKIDNTLAEEFASLVLKNMEGIEEKQEARPEKKPEIKTSEDRKIDIDGPAIPEKTLVEHPAIPEKKEAKKPVVAKTVIAPAFLVIKKDSPSKAKKEFKIRTPQEQLSEEERQLLETKLEELTKQKLFVASEWSGDAYSLEACKLFGYEKRKRMAGAFQENMFDMMRRLNLDCELGLEAVAYSAIFNADFDLHTENFMLKFNISNVSDLKEASVAEALERFKRLIAAKIAVTNNNNIDEALKALQEYLPQDKVAKERKALQEYLPQDKVTKEMINNNEKYYVLLMKSILSLTEMGVEVYFHKIDHDSGFYRYADPKRKVDFFTHRTSPIHVTPEGGFILQPTLHIMELTGAKEQGIDELLLTPKGIDIVMGNNIHLQLETLKNTTEQFFTAIHQKANQFEDLTPVEKKVEEYILLKSFYHHITERSLEFSGSSLDPQIIDSQIKKAKIAITKNLFKGAIYKMNDLHEQLYARVLKIEKNDNIEKPPRLQELKTYLQEQIYNNRMELLFHLWPDLIKEYNTSKSFYSQGSQETGDLIDLISACYHSNPDEKEALKAKQKALNEFSKYAEKYGDKRFCKIVMNHFNQSINIPMNDVIFKEKKPDKPALGLSG